LKEPVKDTVLYTRKSADKVLIAGKTKKETGELSEDFKK
jgi:hypothetical protein